MMGSIIGRMGAQADPRRGGMAGAMRGMGALAPESAPQGGMAGLMGAGGPMAQSPMGGMAQRMRLAAQPVTPLPDMHRAALMALLQGGGR